MERVILHSDLNNFYASVECLYHPKLRDQPVVVGGDEEARHGIVLAKNQIAKAYGIKTGDVLWEARRKCPGLVAVPADFQLYLKFSRKVREIYADYTDLIEPFGIDENWLDVTGSLGLYGSGENIADAIRKRVYEELGVTVSVGVSFNKIFAKLGSDMKKPNATTIITKENYPSAIWQLPAADLLYVGRSTEKKLSAMGVHTIGDLARCDVNLLHKRLGVWGIMLHRFANGEDHSPVAKREAESCIKSVGNSITAPRDLTTLEDVKAVFYMLAESVAARLRGYGLKCTGVQIYIRDKDLISCERQAKLTFPSCLTSEIAEKAMEIFTSKYHMSKALRSIGVRGIRLVPENEAYQLDMFSDQQWREKSEKAERAVDEIRDRFGYFAIQRGILLKDKKLTGINPKDDHIIFPPGRS